MSCDFLCPNFLCLPGTCDPRHWGMNCLDHMALNNMGMDGDVNFETNILHRLHWQWQHDTAFSLSLSEEREYSIMSVMSELSIVRCDRALGLWIVGTRASSVDGELPWRCYGRWTVRWTAVKGSRDRSSDRAAAMASTPGSRAQAATEGGFLGLRHKTKEADGG